MQCIQCNNDMKTNGKYPICSKKCLNAFIDEYDFILNNIGVEVPENIIINFHPSSLFNKLRRVDKNHETVDFVIELLSYISNKFSYNIRNIPEAIYLVKNNIDKLPVCLECGKKVSYENGKFHKFCSLDCMYKSEHTKEKREQTCLENLGVLYPAKSKKVMEKRKKNTKDKYGVEHTTQLASMKEKSKRTCKNNFGVDNSFKSHKVRQKAAKTNLKKYGVENYTQSNEYKEKYRKRMFDYILNGSRITDKYTPLFTEIDYKGITNRYKFKCNDCGTIFESTLVNGKVPRCITCYPWKTGVSRIESELFEYCNSKLNCDDLVVKNPRYLFEDAREIDIYIPSKKLGLEMDGLFWHNESNKNDKKYHLKKTTDMLEKGIHLFHIFEDEWYNKRAIVKSLICYKLGVVDNKVFARNTVVKNLSQNQIDTFLDNNHLQGKINAKINLGLVDKETNNVVSVMSFSTPRYVKKMKNQFEILRSCSKLNTIVVGGLSKLFTYFVRNYNPNGVITYADRRYGEGKSYEKIGFKYTHSTSPGYYYVKSSYRYNRMKFQKHKLQDKLEIFDPELTEYQNMQLNGYDRIWDCGNNVYEWINK